MRRLRPRFSTLFFAGLAVLFTVLLALASLLGRSDVVIDTSSSPPAGLKRVLAGHFGLDCKPSLVVFVTWSLDYLNIDVDRLPGILGRLADVALR